MLDKNKLKTIEKLIRDASEARLKGLIIELCEEFPDAYEHILRWGKGSANVDINDKLAFEYWSKAEKIIDEFNEYGGGPDDEEDEACGFMESISELIPALSWQTRRKIMDGMLVQYHYGNSGFDDMLTDTCFEMCKERDEWLYLADSLLRHGRDWSKTLVMQIYKNIGDDESYLALRGSNLRFGSDYFELVEFYTEKGDAEKALSYALKGLEYGDGSIGDLVKYLFNYYERKNDTVELERIFSICEQKKSECASVAAKLFAYYKTRNDYDNAKKYLLKEFDNIRSNRLDEQYEKVKQYLTDSDWQAVENTLFGALKTRDIEGYMRVCLAKGMKEEVYNIITEKTTRWGNDYDYFADKLKKDFPEKIIIYYLKLAVNKVEGGANRKSYKESMKYFKKAKEIYIKILKDKPRWERMLDELKARYKTKRAFLEEAKVLE